MSRSFKIVLLCTLIASLSYNAHARERMIDSLTAILHKYEAEGRRDSVMVKTLLRTADIAAQISPDGALPYARRALRLAREISSPGCIAQSLLYTVAERQLRNDLDSSFKICAEALRIAEKAKADYERVLILSAIAGLHDSRGNITASLSCNSKARKIAETLHDKKLLCMVINQEAFAQSRAGNDSVAFALAKENVSSVSFIADRDIIFNIYFTAFSICPPDSAHVSQCDTYASAAYALAKEEGWELATMAIDNNLGVLYSGRKQYEKAILHLDESLSIALKNDIQLNVAYAAANLSAAYLGLNQVEKAVSYGRQAITAARIVNAKQLIKNSSATLASAYAKLGDYTNAYCYRDTSATYADSAAADLLSQEMQNLRQSALEDRKNAEIQLLEADKKEQALIRNAIIVGLVLVLVLAFVLYRSYRQRKQSDEANHNLLLNVLPASIALRLKSGETRIADSYQDVSVLFADIVDFTSLSQRITPRELVEGLDSIFSAFDALCEKYHLEKIKTIGDSYMVVAGAPEPRSDHAEVLATMASEMLQLMKNFRSINTGEEIRLRVGLHCGGVVAGVIGKKKFSYDLWGDAVNTASRMESSGEPDRIHCSEEFMKHVSSHSSTFTFRERGLIEIKGKGLMKTYFLSEKTTSVK